MSQPFETRDTIAPSNITKNIGIACCWKKNIWQRWTTKFSIWKWGIWRWMMNWQLAKIRGMHIPACSSELHRNDIIKTRTCYYWRYPYLYIFLFFFLAYLVLKSNTLHSPTLSLPLSCLPMPIYHFLKPRLPPTVKQSIWIWFPTLFTSLSSPSFQRAFAMNEFFQST